MVQPTAVLYVHKIKNLPCKPTSEGNHGSQEWRFWIHCGSEKQRKKGWRGTWQVSTDGEAHGACPSSVWTPSAVATGVWVLLSLPASQLTSYIFRMFCPSLSFFQFLFLPHKNIWEVAGYEFDLGTSRPWNLYNLLFLMKSCKNLRHLHLIRLDLKS